MPKSIPKRDRRVQSALGVIERRGRFLVQRRPPGKFLAGYWEFPGGKRERGETWKACVRRELREELGVTAKVGAELMTLRHRYPGRPPKLFKAFSCRIMRGRPKPLAATALRWVTRRQLTRLRLPPANKPLVTFLAAIS